MKLQYNNAWEVFSIAFRKEHDHGKDFRYRSKQKEQAKTKTAFIINRLVSLVILPSLYEVHLGSYINIFITNDLKMFLVLTDQGKEFLENEKENGKDVYSDRSLYDLLEDHCCNGFELVAPEYCGSADCNLLLTHSCWGLEFSHETSWDYHDYYWHELIGSYDNEVGQDKVYSRKMVNGDYVWHDPNYMIRSQVQDLFDDGIIELELHLF